nr:ATP-binding cassette domain-containing protein [Rothia santali]
MTGPNGAGKSTLLDLLAGRLDPSEGTVETAEGLRVGYLAQEVPAWEEGLAAGEVHRRWALRLQSRGIVGEAPSLASLGLLGREAASTPAGRLSLGQQRRLHLALVLAGLPELLILDEPTNHLSMALVEELTEALGGTRACVVVATHDRQMLRDLGGWPRLELS